jgi:hypothetical protein
VNSRDKTKQTIQDYQITFGTPEGRRVLHDIMKNTYLLSPMPHPDRDEGARNEGLRILTILNYGPNDFIQSAKEISGHGNKHR